VTDERPVGRVIQVSVSLRGVPKLVVERAALGPLGLDGDKHNVRAGHGGPDRAVCLLAMEVIEQLQREGHAVEPGTLGENVTIRGLDWTNVAPGDRLRIGPAVVEVTRFTTPCKSIAHFFKDGDFTRVLHTTNPGEARVYARVIQPGELAAGMDVEHLAPTASPSS